MLKSLISGFDIYLVVLILLDSYIMIFSDSKYFKQSGHMKARRESIVIGIIIFIVVIGGYIYRSI